MSKETKPLEAPNFIQVPGVYAFAKLPDWKSLDSIANPIMVFREDSGATVIALEEELEKSTSDTEFSCTWLRLTHPTSLLEVGIIAKWASLLAESQIPANWVSGFDHDHVFVPTICAERALEILNRR